MLIFYEQDELLLLPNLCRSLIRKIDKEEIFYDFAQLWIKLFRELAKYEEDKAARKACLENMKTQLKELKDSPQAQLLDYFPYSAWLDSKLEQVDMATYLSQQYAI